ncbi:MAG: peptidyl-prolyl cis-trans isomerase [Gemmatimonadota bacterium]|nr:MAG: peptidyl-prolyl cis-trans isomerase [Gemmatimonadota bacterium]
MRRNTKIIMLIVAAAFVGLMVFQWGMDISGRSNPRAVGEVGRVNGTPINYQVWTRTFRSLTDQAREQKGAALDDREIDLIEEQAWDQLLNQILIEQELEHQGITVTDEEIRLAFQTTPPPWLVDNELFQTGGEFDYDKYRAFFSGPAVDPALLVQIEEYYRTVLPRTRLFELIGSGIYVSDSELWSLYRDRNEQLRLRYAVFDPEIQVDDSEVAMTDEELLRYYQEHLEDFQQPSSAEVVLVEFSRVPGPADSAAALETARRIRAEILDGADFAEQAAAYSGDRFSAAEGGDLGWFERGDMTPEFERAAFELVPGEISEPVLTPYGYHIITLTERETDRVRASHILIPIQLRGDSEDQLLASVDRLERIALTSGLEVAIDSLGVPSRRITLAEGSDFVPGMGSFPPVYDWAFHDSTTAGELSRVYETDEGFHVFELLARTTQAYLPFDDAEPAVRRRLLLEKKKETASWLAAQIGAELRQATPFEEVLGAHDLTIESSPLFTRLDFVPGLGQANAVIGTAFGLELNEIAGPVEADDRFFFLKVSERVEANREEYEAVKESLRAQVALQRQRTALDVWLADLREEAEIEDWRRQIFVPGS